MPKLSINRPLFAQALQVYRDRGLLNPDQEDALEWFWGYAAQTLDMDRDRMAAALQYDVTTIHNLLAGNRTASLDEPVSRIAMLRERTAGAVSTLIETPVTRRIFETLDFARNANAMVVIRGETGRSKTFTVMEWARRNNHSRTVYIRCPSGCTKSDLVRLLADAIGIGKANKTTAILRGQVLAWFDRRRTLIVDEAGHLVPTQGRHAREMLDLLRDIQDICGAGVVMVFTSVYWNEVRTGHLAPFFEQFIGRVRYDCHIPEGVIFAEEVEAIVRAHGFADDAIPIGGEIAKEDGKLRTLFGDLANASKVADKTGKPKDAELLRKARAWRHAGGSWRERTI